MFKINLSGLVIRRVLQIFGTIQIFRIIWIVSRNCMSTRRSESPKIDTSKEQKLLEDIRKLNVKCNGIKEEMELFSMSKQNSDQALENLIVESENDEMKEKLQRQIEKNTKGVEAEFKALWESVVIETKAFEEAFKLKHAQNKEKYQASAVVSQTEMRKFRETLKSYESSMKSFQEKSNKRIEQKFKEIQENFQLQIKNFESETADNYEKQCDLQLASEKKGRKALMKIFTDNITGVGKTIVEVETKNTTNFADMEIFFVSKMALEMAVLKFQPEGPPNEVIIYLWQIRDFREQLQGLKEESYVIKCNDFYEVTPKLRFRPVLRRQEANDALDINLEFMDDSKEDADNSPFLHYRKHVLLDQSDSVNKDNLEIIDRPLFTKMETCLHSFYTNHYLVPISQMEGDSKFVRDDKVLIKIVLQPLASVINRLASQNGELCWKIECYSKKILHKEWLVSRPFRTSHMGYNLQFEVMLNGEQKGDSVWISVLIKFILGENDKTLLHPVRGQFSCYLLDQIDPTDGEDLIITKEFGYEGLKKKNSKADRNAETIVTDWVIPKCFLRSIADKEPYCKNDTIHLKAVVTVG